MRPLAVLTLVLSTVAVETACRSGASTLPAALSDQEFWILSTALSEPPGAFTHSDNLVSNEAHFVSFVRMLRPGGGAYIGVGPEQNFSYIARLRPPIAFIIDVRQENRALHLLYKALFELSADRADFVGRLFSRRRPDGLRPDSSVQDLFAAYGEAEPDPRLHESTLASIRGLLRERHRFALPARELEWIEYAFKAFYADGPGINYERSRPNDPPGPAYSVLMTATDLSGQPHSYLATEDAFAFVQDLQVRNLVVPVVGDFSGPRAIRRAGDYIRRHRTVVSAFYGSNVEDYLDRAEKQAFCENLSTVPFEARSWFIASKGMQPVAAKLRPCRAERR